MKRVRYLIITVLILTGVLAIGSFALAQQDLGINALADQGVLLGQTDIRVIIGRIVQIFLGLLGTIAVVLIIYGGWLYMSSAGDSQKISKAKQTLINAVIGLLIILSSLAISQFIVSSLISATSGGGGTTGPSAYSQPLSGSLGAGIIEGHVPERGAIAPRNTKIAITFKEAISETSLIVDTDSSGIFGDNGDLANKDTFKLVMTSVLKANNNSFKNISDNDLADLVVKFTPDKKSFVFAPLEFLGNSTENVSYTAFISPDLKKADGSDAFSGVFSGGYQWEFQIEPKIDTTPPKLISIIPSKGINPRNTIVQLNFSEPLDPTSASGDFSAGSGFQNITLLADSSILDGSYKIANGYRTVEFVTDDLCGMNSCGGNIYCLPGNKLISGKVSAATVSSEPPQSAGFPYNGIVDLAGNSFDGNGDGIASGPTAQSGNPPYNWIGGIVASQGDDIAWQFNTSDQIDLVPPKVSKIDPGLSAQNVGLDVPIEATFDKVMSVFTLNSENLGINHDVPAPYELWYSIRAEALDALGQPVLPGDDPVKTKATIKHGSFAPSDTPPAVQYNYFPIVLSKIQDLRQNCFNPSVGPSCTPTATAPYCCNGALSAVKCSYIP
ncbi:hypothetical protein KKB41_03155 [Patescibacteria group bacterium]|nr:hypothetical protein [Patescibacteria group bacterium]